MPLPPTVLCRFALAGSLQAWLLFLLLRRSEVLQSDFDLQSVRAVLLLAVVQSSLQHTPYCCHEVNLRHSKLE